MTRDPGNAHGTRLAVLLAAVLAVSQLSLTPAAAASSSQGPTGDAWVDSGNPTVNHGANGYLQVDNSPVLLAYLAFSVLVPAGEQVTSAQLQVTPNSSNTGGFDVRTSSAGWTESTLTYANAPAPSASAVAVSGPVSAGIAVGVDVTSAVPATGGAVSLVLSNLTSTSYSLKSKEAASGRPVLVVTTAASAPPPATAPTASFTATPTSGTAPLAVAFTDTSTGGPTSWAWAFGDGATSTVQNPSHTYAAGTFTASLTATNATGSSTSTLVVDVAASSTGDLGHRDGSFTGAVSSPTGEKPQSKLWFNDGSWWADLFEPVSLTHHIWRLDRVTQTWSDTGTRLDDRASTKSDILWDGTKLYVASQVYAASSAAAAGGNPTRLYRYSYSATTRAYTLDPGFPTRINNTSAEAVVITEDSLGQLWATWTAQSKVYANRSDAGGTTWGTPFVLPSPGASSLNSDDISAIVNTGSGKVATLWSNQSSGVLWLGQHPDSAAPSSGWTFTVARSGSKQVDDHISLRSLDRDSSGRLYAVVKTSLNDVTPVDPSAPLIVVMVYTPSTGAWVSATFGRVQDNHTRAILELDATHGTVHVFATGPATAGSGSFVGNIYEKTSPMGALSFGIGLGTPVIRDTHSAAMNNVSSTKQTVTAASGLVVLAGNDSTKSYWHADVAMNQ